MFKENEDAVAANTNNDKEFKLNLTRFRRGKNKVDSNKELKMREDNFDLN